MKDFTLLQSIVFYFLIFWGFVSVVLDLYLRSRIKTQESHDWELNESGEFVDITDYSKSEEWR
jgi:hypothetical protein